MWAAHTCYCLHSQLSASINMQEVVQTNVPTRDLHACKIQQKQAGTVLEACRAETINSVCKHSLVYMAVFGNPDWEALHLSPRSTNVTPLLPLLVPPASDLGILASHELQDLLPQGHRQLQALLEDERAGAGCCVPASPHQSDCVQRTSIPLMRPGSWQRCLPAVCTAA